MRSHNVIPSMWAATLFFLRAAKSHLHLNKGAVPSSDPHLPLRTGHGWTGGHNNRLSPLQSDILWYIVWFVKSYIFSKSLILLLMCLVRYQDALHPDSPIHRKKIAAKQALSKVCCIYFKSRIPWETLIKKNVIITISYRLFLSLCLYFNKKKQSKQSDFYQAFFTE